MSKKLNGKSTSCIIIDEPTRIRPKLKMSLNPARESLWVREFKKWLNDKKDETEI